MEYAPEEYTRHYIVQALFKLMNSYEYEKISVTDIAEKAGVGRATFYRYFKRKEDIIHYYFEHNKRAFIFEQHIYPRCKEDYIKKVTQVFYAFVSILALQTAMFREFAVETQGFDVVVMNAITGLRCIYIKLNVSENSLRNTLKGGFFYAENG